MSTFIKFQLALAVRRSLAVLSMFSDADSNPLGERCKTSKVEVNRMLKVIFSSLCLVFSGLSVNAQVLSGPPVAKSNLPDLVVKEIVFTPPPGTVKVRVMNQGATGSSSCHLALISSMGGENASLGARRVWTIEIPALPAGKDFSGTIVVSPLTETHGPWKAVVDRSNQVKEAKESNNQLSYIATGGTVNAPLPDLKITNAVLVDATTGKIIVEVSNTESVAANASQLRLIVWEMGKFEQKAAKETFTKVPGVAANQKVKITVKAGVPIISTKFSLFIDIGEAVLEKNETNNRWEGEAGKS